jgi:hypothetical protein
VWRGDFMHRGDDVTVNDLMRFLRKLPGDLPVYIHQPEKVYPGSNEDDMRQIADIRLHKESSISNMHVQIKAGQGFGW